MLSYKEKTGKKGERRVYEICHLLLSKWNKCLFMYFFICAQTGTFIQQNNQPPDRYSSMGKSQTFYAK